MQITPAQKRRVAIFFLIGGAIFLILLGIIAGNRMLNRLDCYYTEISDISVAGLSDGSAVRFQGMAVGSVSNISIQPEDTSIVRINFCLKPGVPIREGTMAQLGNIGITGLKYLELKGGGTGPEIPPGGEVPSEKSTWDLLTGQTTVIAAKLENILNNLNVIIAEVDPSSLARIATTMESISASVDHLLKDNADSIQSVLKRTDTLLASSNTLVTNLNQVSGNLTAMTAHDSHASRTLENLERGTRAFVEDYQEVNFFKEAEAAFQLINSVQQTMDTINLTLLRSRENITNSFDELYEGMMNFNEFTRIIMEKPSAIIQGGGSGIEDMR